MAASYRVTDQVVWDARLEHCCRMFAVS